MNSEAELRQRVRIAIDGVAAPRPWLVGAVQATLRRQRRLPRCDRGRPVVARHASGVIAGQGLKIVGALLVLLVLASTVVYGRLARDAGMQSHPTGLSAEQAQLARLEKRPLQLPVMPADGSCPVTPMTSDVQPYRVPDGTPPEPLFGPGPVYASGGTEVDSTTAQYWDVDFITPPGVAGPVLIRGRQLDGRLDVVFAGPFAAGDVVGSDTVRGKRMDLHREALLLAGARPSNSEALPGWGIWPVRQGLADVSGGATGCVGFQVDTPTSSEVVVVSYLPRVAVG